MNTYVYYANMLWGIYPDGIPRSVYTEIPQGSFICTLFNGKYNWRNYESYNYIADEEVPAETRTLHLLLTG